MHGLSSEECGLSVQSVTLHAAPAVALKLSFRVQATACSDRKDMHG